MDFKIRKELTELMADLIRINYGDHYTAEVMQSELNVSGKIAAIGV